jgi:hypothetical protein
MSAITPTQYIRDAVSELLEDWRGQDGQFFEVSAKATIMRHVGKVRSYLAWESRAEIRAHQKQFREAFCAAAHIKLRRLQEATATYKKYAKSGDSVYEIAERIYEEAGNWSRALPAKPEKEPEVCQHKCSIHQ